LGDRVAIGLNPGRCHFKAYATYPTNVLARAASGTSKVTVLVTEGTLLHYNADTHLGDRALEFLYGGGPHFEGTPHKFFTLF
jgi:hypothetical protein